MKLLFIVFSLFLSMSTFSQRMKKVDLSKVKRVSLVYADVAQDLESSFGHIGIRLSVEDKDSIHDISAEFVADTNTSSSGIELYLRGSGLVNPFPVVIQYDFYENYKLNKSIYENRKLEVVELDLTQDELQRFLRFMDDFQNGKISQEYYFLTANCSEIPLNALAIATGRKIKWSNVPYKAINAVKKMPIAKEISVTNNASTKRVKIVEKYIVNKGYEKSFPRDDWRKNFLKDIANPKFELRKLSYLKILWLVKNQIIPKKDFFKLYLKTKKIEFEFDKYLFKSILDPKDLKYKKVDVISLKLPQNVKNNSVTAELKIIDNLPVVQVKYKLRAAGPKKRQKTQLFNASVKDFSFVQHSSKIMYKGLLVGRLVDTGTNRFILNKGVSLHIEQVSAEASLFIYIDQKTENTNLSEDDIINLGHLALRNTNKSLNNGIGACYALTLIQQAFVERALFSNSKNNSLSSEELISLIDKLMKGQYVLFQGFSNISDLTKSIDEKLFVEFVNKVQKERNGSLVGAFWSNLTEREQMTKENLNSVLALLEEGYSLPVHLAFVHKGKSEKLASNIGHVIYLHKLTQISKNRYKVLAYDSNLGTDTFYTLEQNDRGVLILKPTRSTALLMNIGNLEIWPVLDTLDPNRVRLVNILKSVEIDQLKLDKLDSKSYPAKDVYKLIK